MQLLLWRHDIEQAVDCDRCSLPLVSDIDNFKILEDSGFE